MSEFLLSVHHDYSRPLAPEGTDVQARYAAVAALNHDLREAGAWVFAGGLESPSTAMVVSVADGDLAVTEGARSLGPLRLGGFWVIDVPDMESAITWAQRASVAIDDPVEVRPFQGS